jgi:hypothetical protein
MLWSRFCSVYVVLRVNGMGAPMRSEARRWSGVVRRGRDDGLVVAEVVVGQGAQVVDGVAEAAEGLAAGAGLAGGFGASRR